MFTVDFIRSLRFSHLYVFCLFVEVGGEDRSLVVPDKLIHIIFRSGTLYRLTYYIDPVLFLKTMFYISRCVAAFWSR